MNLPSGTLFRDFAEIDRYFADFIGGFGGGELPVIAAAALSRAIRSGHICLDLADSSPFEEQDGGVYVEAESISLTRDIPMGLGWMLKPFVTTIPRESLLMTLGSTRSAVEARAHSSAQK